MQPIVISHLTKSYGEKLVLDRLSLTLPLDKPICLMGESGCGKTTLLRLLAGIEEADGGEISPLPQSTLLFQEDRLLPDFSVQSNLRVLKDYKQWRDKIPAYLEMLGLDGELHTRVLDLSGGMKRRVALLRACLTQSPLLLLDEPFTGLDPDSKKRACDFLMQTCADRAIILVTHDEQDAQWLSARILRL